MNTITKSAVTLALADIRARAIAEQNRLNALGRFSEGSDATRAVAMIEQGIQAVLNSSTSEELNNDQVGKIRAILEPYQNANDVTPAEEQAANEIAERQRRAWGQR